MPRLGGFRNFVPGAGTTEGRGYFWLIIPARDYPRRVLNGREGAKVQGDCHCTFARFCLTGIPVRLHYILLGTIAMYRRLFPGMTFLNSIFILLSNPAASHQILENFVPGYPTVKGRSCMQMRVPDATVNIICMT
jgi:hypothetical protein